MQVKEVKEDDVCIEIFFSHFNLQIIIVTKKEIWLYDSTNGSMLAVWNPPNDENSEASITSFCMDNNHRKYYVGDSLGWLIMMNGTTGVLMDTLCEGSSEEIMSM